MKTLKITGLFLLVIISFIAIFGLWYNYKYSMEIISNYEINAPLATKKLLIASQGSDYKNLIVDRLVSYYENRNIYIKVVDVNDLTDISIDDFMAIVILHTWEMGRPPKPVASFIDNNRPQLHKMIIVTTAGDGVSKMEGVDALTGESIIDAVPKRVEEIKQLLNGLLTSQIIE